MGPTAKPWTFPPPGDLAMLLAASLFTPLRIWAGNSAEVGVSIGLIAWSGLMLLMTLVLWTVSARIGADKASATGSLFWMLIAVGAIGSAADSVPGGYLTLTWAVALLIVMAYRLGTVAAFRYLTIWAALASFVIPVGVFVSMAVGQPASQVARGAALDVGGFARTHDVVILVFDAYGSARVLEEYYDADADSIRDVYVTRGLTVADAAQSNYPLTHYSLAAFFDMSYPIEAGVRSGRSEWNDLLAIINGDNRLVEVFRSEGYEYTLVESGWSGIRCSRFVDRCVGGELIDEATALAISRSLFGGFLGPHIQDPTAAGTLNSIRFLREELPALLDNDRPDLVFVHLMIPHPPLFIDRSCEYRWHPDLGGRTVGGHPFSDDQVEVRRPAYREQVECAQAVIVDVAATLDGDAVLLAFGDHGPDSLGQLVKRPVTRWDENDIQERFGITFVSNAADCGFESLRSLTNAGRQLIGCFSGQPLELLEDRYFLAIEGKDPVGDTTQPVLEIPAEDLLATG